MLFKILNQTSKKAVMNISNRSRGFALSANDLFPLDKLIGSWEGKDGFSITQVPNTKLGLQAFTNLVNTYTEKMVVRPLGGLTPNRGGTKQQWVAGIEYRTEVNDKATGTGIHTETGHMLNLTFIEDQPVGPVDQFNDPSTKPSVTPNNLDIVRLVRQASIPHGNNLSAPGTASVSEGPVKLLGNELLEYDFNIKPSNLGVGIAVPIYIERIVGENFQKAEKALQNVYDDIKKRGGTIGKRWNFFFDTEPTAANTLGGKIVNVSFQSGGNNTSSRLVVHRCKSIFWVHEVTFPNQPPTKMLSYVQHTDLLFNQKFGLEGIFNHEEKQLIVWPHVQVQSMWYAGEPPSNCW
jgi:hypothetical protein